MEPQNILAIETSTNRGSVALVKGGGEIRERQIGEDAFQGRTLAPMIADLLKEGGLESIDIDLVCLGRGPGSYTGLRVGCALARTFAYGIGCAVKAVSSFFALAEAQGVESDEILVLGRAGQEEYCCASFRIEEGRARLLEEHAIKSKEEIRRLAARPGRIMGEGAKDFQEEPVPIPAASHVARLGLVEYKRSGPSREEELYPLYLRRSKAEVNWMRRKAGGSN